MSSIEGAWNQDVIIEFQTLAMRDQRASQKEYDRYTFCACLKWFRFVFLLAKRAQFLVKTMRIKVGTIAAGFASAGFVLFSLYYYMKRRIVKMRCPGLASQAFRSEMRS